MWTRCLMCCHTHKTYTQHTKSHSHKYQFLNLKYWIVWSSVRFIGCYDLIWSIPFRFSHFLYHFNFSINKISHNFIPLHDYLSYRYVFLFIHSFWTMKKKKIKYIIIIASMHFETIAKVAEVANIHIGAIMHIN